MKSDSLFKKRFHIPTTRLQSWDYSSSGYYFITICTHQKKEYFGKIHNRKIELSKMGKIAKNEWLKTKQLRPNIDLDEFVIMPNHIHGILIIRYPVETSRRDVSTTNKFQLKPNSLGSIIGQFKSIVTKRINHELNIPFHWQSRYYDHIIRTEHEFYSIREYIRYNPLKWEEDEENPINSVS